MRIGVPKEIKVHEYRVGLTPNGAAELISAGHEVFVQSTAGDGVGFYDDDYERVGATILPDADAVFEKGELIVKVKEPSARRVSATERAPHPVHLSAPGSRPPPDTGSDGVRLHGDRLRDGRRS